VRRARVLGDGRVRLRVARVHARPTIRGSSTPRWTGCCGPSSGTRTTRAW
jgi:hypothetical protein